MRPSLKLVHKFLGPYLIEWKLGLLNYKIKLPIGMKFLHPVFHVVKLWLALLDPIIGRPLYPPPGPVVVNGEPEYEVEKILDSWMYYQRLQFLVTWKGYSREENSWINVNDVHSLELIKEFYWTHPKAPCQILLLLWSGMWCWSVSALRQTLWSHEWCLYTEVLLTCSCADVSWCSNWWLVIRTFQSQMR